METVRNKFLLLNWIFIGGLLILFINDHYLKWTYANWLTGKLSDFTGLLIFPMFIQFVFPRLSKISVLVTGLFFIFWKSPLSENFIHLYNSIAIIPITRTIDYTDLIALLILPFSHLAIQRVENFKIKSFSIVAFKPQYLLIVASFVFMATSPPISFYMKPGGDIHIGKYYSIKMSREKVLETLKANGYKVRVDTAKQRQFRDMGSYFIDDVVLNNGKDTIKSIEFGFLGHGEKTIFLLNNVILKRKINLSDWKTLKEYSKLYNKLIDAQIIEPIK